MYDRCKGAVSTFVDGVPVCAAHRKHAIANASPEARVDEAGDWVLKKPKDITIPPPVAGDYTFDTTDLEVEESIDTSTIAYCSICAFQSDTLTSANKIYKGVNLCDLHFLEATSKKVKKITKTKRAPKESFDLKPRRIRLPEGDE